MILGTIFEIKRFALHDGDGIRTTLFLKGCHLTCPWCQNPEGQDAHVSLRWSHSKCIQCGICVAHCPTGALSVADSGSIRIDHRKCDQMGICISECPTASLNFDGRIVSAKDISEEILRDRVFFDITGGGITLSGGEPLIQPEFSREVLDICRRAGVPTAVETTLAVTWQIVELMTTVTDRFIVDLKVADEQLHREWLGVELDIIQSNLKRLAAQNIDILIRIPLIPGYTATEENLRELGRFISRLKQLPPVELINFNPLAEGKYRLLGRTWPIPHKSRMFNAEEIADFATILRDSGVERILT